MAFINTGKNRGFFSKNECNYGRLLSDYFGSSCAPGTRKIALILEEKNFLIKFVLGATDFGHDPNATNSDSLCSLCRTMIMPALPTIGPPVDPTIAPPGQPPITIAPPDSITVGIPRFGEWKM